MGLKQTNHSIATGGLAAELWGAVGVMLFAGSVFLCPSLHARSLSMEPITPLETSYRPHTLAQYVMQYQVSDLPHLTSASEFREAVDTYARLRKTSSSDIQGVFDRLYMAMGIKYYVDRVGALASGSLSKETSMSSSQLRSLLDRLGRDIHRDAGFLAKKSTADRSLFLYFRYTSGTVNSEALKSLKKILDDSLAPPALKHRVYFILLHYTVSSHSSVLDLQTISRFEKRYYQRAKSVSLHGRVASSLALAAAYAGVHRGRKIRSTTSKQYTTYLKDVSQRLSRLDTPLKNRVIRDMVGIWLLAEREPDFSRPPFSLSLLLGTPYYYPLLERQAIAHYDRKGKPGGAKSFSWETIYRKMLNRKELSAYHVKYLKRLLDGRFALYQSNKDFLAFEREISWQLGKVSAGKDSHPHFLNHHAVLSKMYRLVVDKELRTVLSSRASENIKLGYIALVDRYIKRVNPGRSDKAGLYERQAQVYMSLKRYASAVKMYIAASQLSANPDAKIGYIALAIKAQHLLARWPSKAPWGVKLPRVSRSSGEALVKLYVMKITEQQKLVGKKMGVVWGDIAHLAHLYLALRQEKEAADVLSRSIVAASDDAMAPMGAYVALGIYERKRLWQSLEDLARFLRKERVQPRLGKAAVSVDRKLALALYEGGKQHHHQKNYDTAIDKFNGFIALYSKDPQVAAVRHYLAQSYWAKKEYLLAIEELQFVIRNHKNYSRYKTVALSGVEWSQALAIEEAVIFFVESYTHSYKDKKAYELRDMVTGLYEGTQRYKEGLANYMVLKAAKHFSQTERDTYEIRLLQLVDQNGTEVEMMHYSGLAIKSSQNPKVLALAYGMQARYYFNKKKVAKLGEIEASLAKLNHGLTEVREVRAQTKLFALRLVDTGELYQEVQNIALADPTGYLKMVYEKFSTFYKQVLSVCQIGPSSVCLGAMNWYKMTGEKVIRSLDEVHINPSYDASVKANFEKTKSTVYRGIERFSKNAHNLAMSSLSRFGSTPQTVLDMLWLNDKDWNFDPLTWGQANGYMNWRMRGIVDEESL